MMKQKFVIFLMVVVALVLVACGGAATDDGPRIFTMLEPRDPLDIDPRSNYDGAGLMVLGQTYETLTHYNAPGSDPEISPELAVSWESSDDAMEWTFVLREGVTFHDGEPFNAEAVKAVVENVRDGDLATSWVFGPIDTVEVVDEYTIKFTNVYPAKLDLIFSSAFGAWMISPNALANGPEWFAEGNSAGTGPYKISNREAGVRITMDRHEAYWGGWEGNKFDTVVYEVVADAAVQEQMLRSGDASLVRAPNWDNLDSLRAEENVDVKIEPSYENQFLMLNNARPPLDNPLVRQAIVASFPYNDVLTNLRSGLGTGAGGAIPQSMWGASTDAIQKQDLQKAAALLAESGVGEIELDYWAGEGEPFDEQVAEVWVPILRDLGVTLNISIIDTNAALESFWSDPATAHHITPLFWFPTYVTPFDPLFSPFSSGEYFNTAAYDNPDFTDLLFAADEITATDLDAAIAMYQEANQMIVDDAAAVFVMDMPVVWLLSSGLDGYNFSPAYGTVVQVYEME